MTKKERREAWIKHNKEIRMGMEPPPMDRCERCQHWARFFMLFSEQSLTMHATAHGCCHRKRGKDVAAFEICEHFEEGESTLERAGIDYEVVMVRSMPISVRSLVEAYIRKEEKGG